MIAEGLVTLLVSILRMAIAGIGTTVSIPLDVVATLGNVCGYGNYIVGMDILGIFAGLVVFWTTVKCTIGIVVFIWRLIPFT